MSAAGRVALALALACAVALHAAAARAEPGAVIVGGRGDAEKQRTTAQAVERTLVAAGWRVAPTPYQSAVFDAAEKCLLDERTAFACLSSLLGDAQLRRFAVVTVQEKPGKNGDTDTIVLERVVMASIDSLFVGEQTCTRCTPDRMTETATDVTRELLDRIAVRSGRTAILATSNPTGAIVYVDGIRSGVTELTVNVAPGPHEIAMVRDGFRREARAVTVVEGTTAPVAVTLQRLAPAPPAAPPRALPFVAMGTGAALAIAGGILIALDQDPVSEPGQQARRTYRDTATAGVIIGAGGLAVAAAGVVWWRYSRSRTAPLVAPVGGGAVMGLTRSF